MFRAGSPVGHGGHHRRLEPGIHRWVRVDVALPAIQADLAARVSDARWIVNAYMLTLGALILVGGAAGTDSGGVAYASAGLCSIHRGLSRVRTGPQRLGADRRRRDPRRRWRATRSSSLAIVSAAFPIADRGRAIGTWAGASALTSALGPVLGGSLVDTWSWRAIFFINLPIGILALLLMARRVPESRR